MSELNNKAIGHLADCIGFLEISPSSGVGSYIMLTEQWVRIGRSIEFVMENRSDITSILDSVEKLLIQVPIASQTYKYASDIYNPEYKTSSEKRDIARIKNYFSDTELYNIVGNSATIHKHLQSDIKFEKAIILISFFFEHIGRGGTRGVSYDIVSGREYVPRQYDVSEHRLSNAFFTALELELFDIKLRSASYIYDIHNICNLIEKNEISLLLALDQAYVYYHTTLPYDDLLNSGAYTNYATYKYYIDLIAQSNLVKNRYDLIIYEDVIKSLKRFYEDWTIEFEKPDASIFTCIHPLRARNAFQYGFISESKFLKYEQKLAGAEKKQISEARDRLININYISFIGKYPGIRSDTWSYENHKLFNEYIRPALEREELIDIDFTAYLYSDYLEKYINEKVTFAYRTGSKAAVQATAKHFIRLNDIYPTYSMNLIKGMLLDANDHFAFDSFFKSMLNTFSPSLEEIVSIQLSYPHLLKYPGDILLSQTIKDNKLYQLFKDDICDYVNRIFIEKGDYHVLPGLLEKYTDEEYLRSNYIKYGMEGLLIGLADNSEEKGLERILSVARGFKVNRLEYNYYNDVYRERFDLLDMANNTYKIKFEHVMKIKIPYELSTLIHADLRKTYDEYAEEFATTNNLKVGLDRWVSEKHLYYRIVNSFPTVKVIRHARPTWLGQQHFDIYIPSHNVAIEYNGVQHYEPVDIFGGVDGLDETIRRDRKKLRLAEANKTTVLIHKYNDDINSTIRQLDNIINSVTN